IQDGAGTGTGKYTVSLARLNKPCNATPLGCGTLAAGQIDAPLRVKTFSLDAQAGDTFMLRLLRSGTSSFTPKIDVYLPDTGTLLRTVRTTDLANITFTATAAGTYNVIASDDSDGKQTGAFTLSTVRLNRPCDGSTALGCG